MRKSLPTHAMQQKVSRLRYTRPQSAFVAYDELYACCISMYTIGAQREQRQKKYWQHDHIAEFIDLE